MTEIVVDTDMLRSELGFVERIARLNDTNELLQCVLCEIEDGVMRLKTTADGVVALSAIPLAGDGYPSISFAVKASPLYRRLSRGTDGVATIISIEEKVVTLSWGRASLRLPNRAIAEGELRKPPLCHAASGTECGVLAADLARAVAGAVPFIYRLHTAPVDVNSLFFVPKKDRIEVVACNPGGAYAASLTPVLGQPFATPMAISPKYAGVIGGLTPVPTDLVTIAQVEGFGRFDCAPRSLSVPLAEGKIPSFDDIFGVSHATAQIRGDAEKMNRCLAVMAVGASKLNWKLNFLVIDDTRLVLYRIKPFQGCVSGCTEMEVLANGTAAFALESIPLRKFLRPISGTVTIHVAPEVSNGPWVIRWVAENGTRYAASAMPVDPPGNPPPWEDDDTASSAQPSLGGGSAVSTTLKECEPGGLDEG